MPKLTVTKPFKYSPNGTAVREYDKGEHEVSERCAEIAVAEGWGRIAETKRRPRREESE